MGRRNCIDFKVIKKQIRELRRGETNFYYDEKKVVLELDGSVHDENYEYHKLTNS